MFIVVVVAMVRVSGVADGRDEGNGAVEGLDWGW
jgi:hypothetical protein